MRRGVALVALCCLWACAGDPRTGAPAARDPAELIPSASLLPGFRLADGPSVYDSESLFQYLDGGAPRYLDLGFVRLAHARFVRSDGDPAGVTLDVFDMGSRLGAFGIYASGRPREIVARDWGAEGYRIGEVAAAWKERIYVHVLADDPSPDLASAMERLVTGVIAAVPGETSPPEILERLPREGLVPHSTRYVPEDLLGHAFLPGGLLASYACGSKECSLFVSELESPSAAGAAFESLRRYEGTQGRLDEGARTLAADDPGLGPLVVTRAGRLLVGVWGGDSENARRRILDAAVAAGSRERGRP